MFQDKVPVIIVSNHGDDPVPPPLSPGEAAILELWFLHNNSGDGYDPVPKGAPMPVYGRRKDRWSQRPVKNQAERDAYHDGYNRARWEMWNQIEFAYKQAKAKQEEIHEYKDQYDRKLADYKAEQTRIAEERAVITVPAYENLIKLIGFLAEQTTEFNTKMEEEYQEILPLAYIDETKKEYQDTIVHTGEMLELAEKTINTLQDDLDTLLDIQKGLNR